MVLESIISPEKAENKPALMIFLGFFYTSIAMFLSYNIFTKYSSLFMVFLATVASVPIIYRLMKLEEQKDMGDMEEKLLLKEHWKALSSFLYLFLGAMICFAFWYVVLPSDTVSVLFQTQQVTISDINNRPITAAVTGPAINQSAMFTQIFFNNVKVLLFCILFSFVYGAGSVFILLWNASIVGTAIGNYIREQIAKIAMSVGSVALGQYFTIVSIGVFRYFIHGFFEILAYFVAALAGGIISIAIINHDYSTRKFEHILLDSADLLILSIIILFIAAILEVYVTPVVFPIQ